MSMCSRLSLGLQTPGRANYAEFEIAAGLGFPPKIRKNMEPKRLSSVHLMTRPVKPCALVRPFVV